MKKTYKLTNKNYPIIPTPHDCIIKEFIIKEFELDFVFGEDLGEYDYTRLWYPNAKTLTMRFMSNEKIAFDVYEVLDEDNKIGSMKIQKEDNLLNSFNGKEIWYLYHWIGPGMIIKIFNYEELKHYYIEINCDMVITEWD